MKKEIKDKYFYLILSFFSGCVELGCIIFSIQHHYPIYAIFLIGLAYQIGALFTNPIKLPPLINYFLLIISFLIVIIFPESIIALALTVLLLSVSLQFLRNAVSKEAKVSTLQKRVSRVLGFLISPVIMQFYFFGFISIIILVISLFTIGTGTSTLKISAEKTGFRFLGIVMIFHQSHYFSYSYLIPVIFAYYYRIPFFMLGFIFCMGWISYLLSEKIFAKMNLVNTFILGHIFVSLVLFVLFLFSTKSLLALIILWFLSGFGGGTVFCLRRLNFENIDLDLSENVGHVIGLLVGIIASLIFSNIAYTFIIAMSFAITTFVLFFLSNYLPIFFKKVKV